MLLDGFKVGDGFGEMVVASERQAKLELSAEGRSLRVDLRQSSEGGSVLSRLELALHKSDGEGGLLGEKRFRLPEILNGTGIFAAFEGNFAEERVYDRVVGLELGRLSKMLFGGGEVFQGKFVDGEITERGIEARVDFEGFHVFVVGGGKVTFLGESDAEEIQSLEVARLGSEKRAEKGDAFVELALTDESFSARVIGRR